MTPEGRDQRGFFAPRPGDRAGFERLMADYQEFLRQTVETGMDPRLRSVLETEDVIQDVMIAAYRSIGHGDFPNHKAFQGWLGVLAKNRLIDLSRRHLGTLRRRSRPVSLDETLDGDGTGHGARRRERLPSADPSPSAIATRREAAEALETVLAGIPAQYRKIIRLVHVERLSTREIAARTGKTCPAVRKSLSRALDACRQALKEVEKP